MGYYRSIYFGPVIVFEGTFKKSYEVFNALMTEMSETLGIREDSFHQLQRHVDFTSLIIAPGPIDFIDSDSEVRPKNLPNVRRRYYTLSSDPRLYVSDIEIKEWKNWLESNYSREIEFIRSKGYVVEINFGFFIDGC